MDDQFDWDDIKNESNVRKHGVDFKDVRQMFKDGTFDVDWDQETSGAANEERFRAIGFTPKLGAIIVVYVEEPENFIRIISAWKRKD